MVSLSRWVPTQVSFCLVAALLLAGLGLLGCAGSVPRGQEESHPPPQAQKAADATKTVTPSGSPLIYGSREAREAAAAQATAPDTSKAVSAVPEVPKNAPAATAATAETTENRGTPGELPVDEDILLYYGSVDNEDSASAVDDAVWRLFDLAEEYHSMGVLANREASWEEAQYYFEKSIRILAGLDIEEDSIPTPEAVKYSSLLRDVVSDYRMTLRSLGELQGDVTPSVMLERFSDVEDRLIHDSLQVYAQQTEEISYDLPVKMNDRVKSSIIYFQTVAKDAFRKYLGRSKRYDRLFRETLNKYGLPEDLVYLSLVESGYNPKAYSWARASGLWQFISSTGKLYGLDRNWWIDERRDPVKSTDAACRFLRDLYKQFGDWELAMAAYNGGPGRVKRTIQQQRTDDFWKMKLKRQTMDYVPLIYAAAIIAKDPERYGFTDVEFEPPILWDEVAVDKCLDLKVVAQTVGCSVTDLQELNPELLRTHTPPNYKQYKLKIPAGTAPAFLAAYDAMPSPKETTWVKHDIRRGETIGTIASKYGVSQYAILEANNLNSRSRIYAGKQLIVPVPLERGSGYASSQPQEEYRSDGSVYKVRGGDTLWDIAKAFGTTVDALRRINYIERGSRIYVGQRLKIPSNARNLKDLNTPAGKTYASADEAGSAKQESSSRTAPASTYKVRVGDTLWDIARRHGTTTAQLRSLNSLGRNAQIHPGQVLRLTGAGSVADYVIHRVQRGETLSNIARQYNTTIARILASNSLDNPDNLQVGHRLRIELK